MTAREGGEVSIEELLRVLDVYGEVELQDVTIHVDRLVLRRTRTGRLEAELEQGR